MNNTIKTDELVRSLIDDRMTIAPWDGWRHEKVGLILEAIKRTEKNATLEKLQKTLTEISEEREKLKELEVAAIQLLHIHYQSLVHAEIEANSRQERRRIARNKIKEQKKKLKFNFVQRTLTD